ncbi:hypothetical protein ACFL29_00390 [Patescibacteria group bacterium]
MMKKFSKILLFLAIFCVISAGIFIYDAHSQAKAEQCFYPFMYIDDMDAVYNHSLCEGNFQVYYFPVIADGRNYTITLHTIEGKQKLYASRYKDKVDNLSSILNWSCYHPSCASETDTSASVKFITFQTPSGEPAYYSWFAVYGETAGRYQIGISNSGVLQFVTAGSFTPENGYNDNGSNGYNNVGGYTDELVGDLSSINWKAENPKDSHSFGNISWTSTSFNDSFWDTINLPDKNWGCDDCYKQYRGTFYLDNIPSGLKLHIESDDGVWLYVNHYYIGHWGSDDPRRLLCANGPTCGNNEEVDDIPLTNLRTGKNVISAVVLDSGFGEYFNVSLVQ